MISDEYLMDTSDRLAEIIEEQDRMFQQHREQQKVLVTFLKRIEQANSLPLQSAPHVRTLQPDGHPRSDSRTVSG